MLRLKVRASIGGLLITLSSPVFSQESPRTGSVSGVVRDPAGAGLPGVIVTLTMESGESFLEVSGTSGEFKFAEVPAGRCQFVAALPGYEDFVTEKVHEGRSILGLYPPTDEQTNVDFAAWRKRHGR